MHELKLVASLFDQEVRHTLKYLASMKKADWCVLSQPWDSFLFHGQSVKVSVEAIIRHMAMLESHVIDSLKSSEDRAVLPTEGETDFCTHEEAHQQLINCYRAAHEENMQKLHQLNERDMQKKLTFLSRPYTGVGLLWMLTGHHAFHLGQLRSMALNGAD